MFLTVLYWKAIKLADIDDGNLVGAFLLDAFLISETFSILKSLLL